MKEATVTKNPEATLFRLSKQIGHLLDENFFLSPESSSTIVKIYTELLTQFEEKNIEFNKLAIANKKLEPSTISSQLAQQTQKEITIIDDNQKPSISNQDKIVIVSDVLSTGKTIQKATETIQNSHGQVVGTIILLDQQTSAKNFEVISFITRDRMLAWGFAEPTLNDLENKDFLNIMRSSFETPDKNSLGQNEELVKKLVDQAIKNRSDSKI
jgi:hypoxanthine phosphoribosyltransferase